MKKIDDPNWSYQFDCGGSASWGKCQGRYIILRITDVIDPLERIFSGSCLRLSPEESVAFGEELVKIGKEKIEAHRNGNKFEATAKRSLSSSTEKS